MEEVLEIENFGPISKAKINLKKYIVLIGPQSSGKSTIAKLIALFNNQTLLASNTDGWTRTANVKIQ